MEKRSVWEKIQYKEKELHRRKRRKWNKKRGTIVWTNKKNRIKKEMNNFQEKNRKLNRKIRKLHVKNNCMGVKEEINKN